MKKLALLLTSASLLMMASATFSGQGLLGAPCKKADGSTCNSGTQGCICQEKIAPTAPKTIKTQ